MNKIVFFISVIVLFACNGKKEVEEGENTKILEMYLDEETSSPCRLSEFFDSVAFVPISSDSLIGNVSNIYFFRGHFYILDSKTATVIEVDGKGNIVHVLSEKGRGPGEYVGIDAFDINPFNGDIHIYDWASKHILVYDHSGAFLRNVPVSDVIRDFAVFQNNEYVFYTPDFMKGNRRGLWRADSLGNFKEQLVSIDENFRYGGIYPKYLNRVNDQMVSLMGGEDYDRIYHIKADSITVRYRLDVDRKIPDELKKSEGADYYQKYAGVCYTKNNYLETDRLLMVMVSDMKKQMLLLYDKVNRKASYVRKQQDLIEDLDAYTMPRFSCNGMMVGVLNAGFVLNFKVLKEKFPFITADSNPILVVYYLK